MVDLSRRHFIQQAGILSLASMLPFRFALASTPTNKRLLVVILRGAMDGLHAVVPYSDSNYAAARGSMALPQNAEHLIVLDKTFALHKALEPIAPLYTNKELLILHAAATPYRERSHFDAQDLLENGSNQPHQLSTGWLNRAVASMPGSSAIALGPSVPLLLRGNGKVTSWAPPTLPDVDDDFMARVIHMYENDALLNGTLQGAMNNGSGISGNGRGQRAFISMMQQAATFMAAPAGPRIGSIDLGGWDTHTNQGLATGRLPTALKILAEGLVAYRQGMGAAWNDTAVLVMTEFGRTVKANGSGGTDHGTASVAFLLGGAVNGGRIVGDWPGLARLYEDRDLMPVNDIRGLLKGTLVGHLGIPDAQVSGTVFPNSAAAAPIAGLFRS